MGATATYSLPYPELDEPDDVPTDMRELATAVEALPPLAYWTKSGTTLVAPAAVAAPNGNVIAKSGATTQVLIGQSPGGFGYLSMGSASDVNVYRWGAHFLMTDSSIWAGYAQAVGSAWLAVTATGDNQPRLGMLNNGFMYWGDGNVGVDTNLHRVGVATLQTDGTLIATGDLQAYGGIFADLGGTGRRLYFGSAYDASLYRSAANTLRTDGQFQAVGGVVTGSGTGQIWLNTNAAIYFSDVADTYIYRSAALQLATNGELTARVGANAVTIGAIGPGYGMLVAGDTSLYRLQAGWLKTGAFWTTGEIVSEGQLSLIGGTNLAKIVFGNAADTSLYRIGAGQLATNGLFAAGQQVYANFGVASQIQLANDGAIYFGSANDTKLYRSGVGALATTGTLAVGSTLISNGMTIAGDTNLYRVAAGYLKTDGTLIVGGKLRLGPWAAANASASVIARIPVYDVNETQSGYLHVYDS